MGQRDLIIKWAIGAGKAKKELVKKGQVVDDAGAFFGWGVENAHLGKTEIFCRYDPVDPDAEKAVQEWFNEQTARAYNEHYFIFHQENQIDKYGPGMSNFHLWWRKLQAAIDPNGLTNF